MRMDLIDVKLFPACAGVILCLICWNREKRAVPRMCGGDPEGRRECGMERVCSPHVRG